MTRGRFPDHFLLGAATSAYQIEGAWNEGGKGESIWDRFVHTPGTVVDGSVGDVACDHVHRWQEDVDAMAELDLDAYRFSISWPRVLPRGIGAASPEGFSFYDRLVDRLLERGIEPFATLYHWDLPQALQDAGGWPARATADAFAEYAHVVGRRLGDRVKYWMTLNEPFVSAFVGHLEGRHAPGHRSEVEALAAVHHLLLAHGKGVAALRDSVPGARVGVVLNLGPAVAASSSEEDRLATEQRDGTLNRTFLDPLAGRGYPDSVTYDPAKLASHVRSGDLESIAAPLDYLGVNYYFRMVVQDESLPEAARAPRTVHLNSELTTMGWEVYPEGLYDLLVRLHADYEFPAYYITENGAAYPDRPDPDGIVRDAARISYLRRHLEQALRARDAGVPLEGYFVWSLLDNFEWAYGETQRFGLLRVDFASGRRIPKASFAWYRRVIAERRLVPVEDPAGAQRRP